jgi:hypothetical protein
MKLSMILAGVLLAASTAAPAVAEETIRFPEKIQRSDFLAAFADTGPVFIGGQPTADALRQLVSEGVTTIINLRTPREMDNRKVVPFDEAALLSELGVEYIHVPLDGMAKSICAGSHRQGRRRHLLGEGQGASSLHHRLARKPYVGGLSRETPGIQSRGRASSCRSHQFQRLQGS